MHLKTGEHPFRLAAFRKEHRASLSTATQLSDKNQSVDLCPNCLATKRMLTKPYRQSDLANLGKKLAENCFNSLWLVSVCKDIMFFWPLAGTDLLLAVASLPSQGPGEQLSLHTHNLFYI